jgi:hypothetical protein
MRAMFEKDRRGNRVSQEAEIHETANRALLQRELQNLRDPLHFRRAVESVRSDESVSGRHDASGADEK